MHPGVAFQEAGKLGCSYGFSVPWVGWSWGIGRGSDFRKGPVRSDNIPEEMSILFASISVVDGAQPREAGSCFSPLPRAW